MGKKQEPASSQAWRNNKGDNNDPMLGKKRRRNNTAGEQGTERMIELEKKRRNEEGGGRRGAPAPLGSDQRQDVDGAPRYWSDKKLRQKNNCEEVEIKEEVLEKEERFTCGDGKKLRVARQVRGV